MTSPCRHKSLSLASGSTSNKFRHRLTDNRYLLSKKNSSKRIKVLENKLKNLLKLRQESYMTKNTKYKDTLKRIEETQKKCADLYKEIEKQKENENSVFENYITIYEDKEKIQTEMASASSHQRMTLKLLHETLVKRNSENKRTTKRNQDLVKLYVK